MKSKDYFSKLKTQGKITLEEFDKFVEAVPDFELPDSIVSSIEQNFLTRDRAVADKDIYRKVYAEALNGVDSKIKSFYPSLTDKDRAAIDAEINTFEKLEKLDAAWKRQIETLKTTSPDSATVNEEYKKNIKELTEKLETVKNEKDKVLADQEKTIKEITAKTEKELKNFKIKTDLTGRLAQIELAKEFTEHPKVKTNTFNTILGEILKNELDYDQEGQIVVQEIHNGVPKPKFFPGTNDQVTIDKLLETETSPYLKRNNADPGQQNTPSTKVISNGAPKKGTLAEMRAAAALAD
jgi:hypothetical protein